MKRILPVSILFIFLIISDVTGQRDSLRSLFRDAESWFLFEEYDEALPLYMALHEHDPANDNINYKIGICLLNDPYRKETSIEYLLDATDNIDPAYKVNNYKETSAPPDVLFHLGNAYLVNQRLDRAVESYRHFLEILDPEVYDTTLVQAQLRACENARRLRRMPVDIDLQLLDSLINTGYPDIQPVISGDGRKMAFVTELPFYDGAFFCERTATGWSYPQLITQDLGFDADIYPATLSHDGTEMVLYYDDDYIGNLYYSTYEDGRWNPAVLLDEPISTKYWESHACFSSDGKTLYFTSNRKGGHGGLDIYRSNRLPDGTWGQPFNLGPTVNSRFNEETPFITEDGNRLYFSSYGHYNMGGYDIFYSTRKPDGSWSDPVNLGYPINTTGDDRFFHPVDNGRGAYYAMYREGGMGMHDIYYLDIYSVDNPRLYLISGRIRTGAHPVDTSLHTIFVVDVVTGDTVTIASPLDEQGTFSLELPRGDYRLHFQGKGYHELIRPLKITKDTDKDGIEIGEEPGEELALQPLPRQPVTYTGEESRIGVRDTLVTGTAGMEVEVPLRRLERGSRLVASLYSDSLLVRTDTFRVERKRMSLDFIPVPGKNLVVLEMTDPEGNIHLRELTLMGEVPERGTALELDKMDGRDGTGRSGTSRSRDERETGASGGETRASADQAGVSGDQAGVPADQAGVPADQAGVQADQAGVPGEQAGIAGGDLSEGGAMAEEDTREEDGRRRRAEEAGAGKEEAGIWALILAAGTAAGIVLFFLSRRRRGKKQEGNKA